MSKRKKCSNCQRPDGFCVCHAIRPLTLSNKVTILQDTKEASHPFATAKFASLASKEIELITSDKITNEFISATIESGAFLLFKNEDSKPISIKEIPSKNFVVLDGTWKKARKIYHTWPSLRELPCFHLEVDMETIYQTIRKSCGETHLSTLEAIGITLQIIDEINSEQFQEFIEPLKLLVKQQEEQISGRID